MRTNRRTNDCHYGCGVEAALDVIGGRWKGLVLYHLLSGKKRFNEFRRLMPSITVRMLTLQLRELEQDGIVSRHVYPEVPPKVEYELTELGQKLEPLLIGLRDWGRIIMNNETSAS